ncbi:hypothetical protein TNCV_428881 [Trichonephila clavipes]|nr:hypothetical protein TNCV_428881 [Trichonephila clavipes]
MLQLDSVSAHKAKKTQEWCKVNLSDITSSEEWPTYWPDLNPMDYSWVCDGSILVLPIISPLGNYLICDVPPLEDTSLEVSARARGVGLSVVPARISSQSSQHCWISRLPHASALIQRDFGYVLVIQHTKQLPQIVKVDLVWQLRV